MPQVGDIVRVLPPFQEAFPDTYLIEYINRDGVCGICEDRDFDPKFLEIVKERLEKEIQERTRE